MTRFIAWILQFFGALLISCWLFGTFVPGAVFTMYLGPARDHQCTKVGKP